MNKALIQVCVFAILAVLTIGSVQNPFTSTYIESLTSNKIVVSASVDSLRQKIKERANEFKEDPQNAKIDKVWKAVPGRNGIEVDVEASLKKMQQEGIFDEKRLVYKEIPPKISLEDLDPAPIYKGHPEKKMVSFIINVAWGNEYLPGILKTLKKEGVHATFFLEGKWTKKNPELAKTIVDAGHEVGNHSYSHPNFKQLSKSAMARELKETNSVIKAVTEKTPLWFGPPSGSFNDQVVKVAADANLKTVLWTVDTIDWKNPDPNQMVDRVTNKVHAGAIILMHPTSSTEQGMALMIKNIKKKGLQIDKLSKMLSEARIK